MLPHCEHWTAQNWQQWALEGPQMAPPLPYACQAPTYQCHMHVKYQPTKRTNRPAAPARSSGSTLTRKRSHRLKPAVSARSTRTLGPASWIEFMLAVPMCRQHHCSTTAARGSVPAAHLSYHCRGSAGRTSCPRTHLLCTSEPPSRRTVQSCCYVATATNHTGSTLYHQHAACTKG
jgi:hypothetical protein